MQVAKTIIAQHPTVANYQNVLGLYVTMHRALMKSPQCSREPPKLRRVNFLRYVFSSHNIGESGASQSHDEEWHCDRIPAIPADTLSSDLTVIFVDDQMIMAKVSKKLSFAFKPLKSVWSQIQLKFHGELLTGRCINTSVNNTISASGDSVTDLVDPGPGGSQAIGNLKMLSLRGVAPS